MNKLMITDFFAPLVRLACTWRKLPSVVTIKRHTNVEVGSRPMFRVFGLPGLTRQH